MSLLDGIASWPCANAAALFAIDGEVQETFGDTSREYSLASVTKLLTAAAVLIGHEEGSVDVWDDPDGGGSLADLLSHASGLDADGRRRDDPGRRRMYSNAAYERAAGLLAVGSGLDFSTYLTDGLLDPLGMSQTVLSGSPAFGASSTVTDLWRFVSGLAKVLSSETLASMTSAHRPELSGVLPGYGRQSPNSWGLGPEIRGQKFPHWTGPTTSPTTWGHFGQAGTFVWTDPARTATLVVLTDLPFGDWAKPAWSQLSEEAVVFADS